MRIVKKTYGSEINLMSNVHDIQDWQPVYYGVRMEIVSRQEIGFGFTNILCLGCKKRRMPTM
jgi:hypothetical protein